MFSATHTATFVNKEYESLSQSHMGGGKKSRHYCEFAEVSKQI